MKQVALLLFLMVSLQMQAQQIIDLYSSTIPNSKDYSMKEKLLERDGGLFGYQNVWKPTLAIYLPDEGIATGAGVVICPGGGYTMESYKLEGIKIAEEFSHKGVAAFILKYRLPSDSIMIDKSTGPLQDAQQAIKIVRMRALEWKLNPLKIGIMGFSAGGHLASTAGTHFDKSYIPNDEKINLRPDFMILVYPVISMTDELGHRGSRRNLLGGSPDEAKIKLFSNELQVNSNTPPAWLTHTGDDRVVSVENSIRFYEKLIENKVPAEMHLYPKGDHGFVLHLPTNEWMQSVFDWMKSSDIIQ